MYTWRCIWSSVVQVSAVSWMHHFIELFTVLEDNWTKIKYFDCFSVVCYGCHRCDWEACCMHEVLRVLTPGPGPETVKGVFRLAVCWMTCLYKFIKLILQPLESGTVSKCNMVWIFLSKSRRGRDWQSMHWNYPSSLFFLLLFLSGPIAAQSRAECSLSKVKAKHDQAWSPSGWVIVLC